MQPIIVAIDFSNTSVHCIEYAIPIANKAKSDILLIWVDKVTAQESLYPDTSNENRNEAKRRFDELLKEYGKKMAKGLKIEYKMRKGKVVHEVDTLAKNSCALMIIAGTHGISGFTEYWIGSNAFRLVTHASVPVLTVRNDFRITKSIRKFLVPVDSSPETLQKVPFVTKLAGLFNSEIYVVATDASNLKSMQRISEKHAKQAAQHFEKNGLKVVRDTILSNDVTKSLITYSTKIGADMISIITEAETPMNILLGPHSQQLITQSAVPVVSVHPHDHFCL